MQALLEKASALVCNIVLKQSFVHKGRPD